MTRNMGTLDRVLRALLAMGIGYLWWTAEISGVLGAALAVAAVVMLLTSLVSFCPLYRPLGISTCGKRR
jgi:Protein of unknown function (DUF2892)